MIIQYLISYSIYDILQLSPSPRIKSIEEGFFPWKEVINMPCKKTSKGVATKASKALRDGRTSSNTKSIAGSALSQRQPSHVHKKK